MKKKSIVTPMPKRKNFVCCQNEEGVVRDDFDRVFTTVDLTGAVFTFEKKAGTDILGSDGRGNRMGGIFIFVMFPRDVCI